jgi:hypothetical protein
MTSYRGMAQANLIRSINDALALLETHSTGAVCQKYIDDLRIPNASGQSKLSALAAAQDDISLTTAVKTSGTSWLFMRAREVLKFHALNNTDGKGYDVLKRLTAWGAMNGAMTLESNAFDAEFKAWLKERSIKSAFNKTISVLSGKDIQNFESPMHRYGLVIDDLTSGKLGYRDPAVTLIRNKVEEALDPFYDLDEVDMTGLGGIAYPQTANNYQGIIFNSTLRAAQAVADAFPDEKIVDEKENVISPSVPKPPKKNFNAPN